MWLASYIIITPSLRGHKLEAIIVMWRDISSLASGEPVDFALILERYISLAVVPASLMLIYLIAGLFKTISNNWIATMNGYTARSAIYSNFPT